MNILRFSHDYQKLPVQWDRTQAILIGIQRIADIDALTKCYPQLIKTDTMFRGEEGFYPLTFKEGILLTFFHLNSSRLFTTIRRFTVEKYRYYEMNTGEIFELMRIYE